MIHRSSSVFGSPPFTARISDTEGEAADMDICTPASSPAHSSSASSYGESLTSSEIILAGELCDQAYRVWKMELRGTGEEDTSMRGSSVEEINGGQHACS